VRQTLKQIEINQSNDIRIIPRCCPTRPRVCLRLPCVNIAHCLHDMFDVRSRATSDILVPNWDSQASPVQRELETQQCRHLQRVSVDHTAISCAHTSTCAPVSPDIRDRGNRARQATARLHAATAVRTYVVHFRIAVDNWCERSLTHEVTHLY
jgi:hypothetical protein